MANFFGGARDFTINGGSFGPDYSRHTTYNGNVHRTNDYSHHTTNYGGYTNLGQHADDGGSINNYGSQTTNHGPVHGYQQPSGGYRRSPRPPLPPGAYEEYRPRPPRGPLPNTRPHRPPQRPSFQEDRAYGAHDSDGNINDDGDDDFSDEEEPPMPPPPRAQRTVPPRRPQGKQPANPDKRLNKELEKLSPDMQRYLQTLMQQNSPAPTQPERDLQERMAGMEIDDAGPSRSPAARKNARNPPRGDPRTSELYRDNYAEDPESDEDSDSLPGGSVIRNIDSQNVNSSAIVDSHNDNSTRTEINKTRRAR